MSKMADYVAKGFAEVRARRLTSGNRHVAQRVSVSVGRAVACKPTAAFYPSNHVGFAAGSWPPMAYHHSPLVGDTTISGPHGLVDC